MSSSSLLLALSIAAGTGWVDGPQAPTSTAPLPPATAPRDGEPSGPRPVETLVVAERPPEDTRADVDDGSLAPLLDLRWSTRFDRQILTRGAVLDLESFLQTAAVPGFSWLSTSSGAAQPVARGHDRGQIGLVVDGVPVVDGFGLVAPTEVLSLVGAASLTFQHGARAFAPTTSNAGMIDVDTGGPLTDMGESARTDGLLAAGIGGADLEKGVTTLLRTGWRTARVIGHATLLHRNDQRPGRSVAGIPAVSTSTNLLANSGGAGGSAGLRVDIVPVTDARLFVSWLSGRGVDVPEPALCGDVDLRGRPRDCVRATERGVDLGVVGFDIVRGVNDVVVAPRARIHLQRALSFDDRSGIARDSVDIARDEVVRGGASIGANLRLTHAFAFGITPSADVVVDVYADRASSSFFTRSLSGLDAEPTGDGLAVPAQARAVDGAVVRQKIARARLRFDHALFGVEGGTRLQLQQVAAAAAGDRAAVDAGAVTPSLDIVGRVHITDSVDTFASVGSVEGGLDVAGLLHGPGFSAVTTAPPASVSDRFVEVGVATRHAAVDVDAVFFGSLRDAKAVVGSDGVVGVEGRVTLKPGLDGLLVRGTLAGVVIDDAPLTTAQAPRSRVIQPQATLQAQYQPTTLPFGFYAGVNGALPQTRLSAAEEADASVCPERALTGLTDGVACAGVAGFALVDLGAYLQLGQLRFDLGADNLLDQQGTWRGAVLGSGGASARARVAFLF